MKKYTKWVVAPVGAIIALSGVVGGKVYMDKQAEVQVKKDVQVKYYETEIAKKVKAEFPDVEEISFTNTSVDSNTGFWNSTFYIKARWTKNAPKDETLTSSQPFTPDTFENDVTGAGLLTELMQNYDEKGKTITPVKVVYSVGGERSI